MGFCSQIEGPIKKVLDDLMADVDLRKQITYRRYDSQEFSKAAGHMVNSYTDSVIYALRLRHDNSSQIAGVGPVQVGDQLYLLRDSDAPSSMSLKDEIVDEFGVTQKIKDITPIFGLAVSVTVEGGY